MPAYFFDASAAVKRYIKETGTRWTLHLFRPHSHNPIYVSEIALVEVTSALARRHRNQRSNSDNYGRRAAKRFQIAFRTKFFKARLELSLIEKAAILAEKHFLRGYDAIQLASALAVETERQAEGMSPLIFVSADHELNQAAEAEGLMVDNPNDHL